MSVTDRDDYVDDLLGRIDEAFTDAAALSLTCLGVDQLNTWLIAIVRLVSQAQGLQVSAMQEAEAAGLAPRFGSRILTTHLAKTTNGNAKVIGSDRTLAVWLRDFPVIHQGLVDGLLTRSHLLAIKEIDCPKIRSVLVRDQALFVDAAKNFVWPDWKGVVAYWLNAANPDGTLTDPTDPAYGMTVRTKTNGDVSVTILMDPVTGEAFLTMHEAEVEKLSCTEREDPNCVPVSLRSKNLMAFMKILIRGWRRADGSEPVPLVNIVMSETVAEDLLARTFGHESPDGESPLDLDPFELPINWADIEGRCETIRGTPIHPRHALGILLGGKLRRTVMNAESQVTDLGEDVRFFSKAQRNALLVQSRGQCVDGSQTPFGWLQADHICPHSTGGPTNLANGAMRGRRENQAKGNQEGWG